MVNYSHSRRTLIPRNHMNKTNENTLLYMKKIVNLRNTIVITHLLPPKKKHSNCMAESANPGVALFIQMLKYYTHHTHNGI